MGERDLTPAERNAVSALHRLAKRWPKTLWLFSANGSLFVMSTDEGGERVYTPDGNVSSAMVLDRVNIPNDGGDW